MLTDEQEKSLVQNRSEAELSLLNVGLPKWPQMKACGEPVTREQATEIIRRTDFFFDSFEHAGHCAEFREKANKILGLDQHLPGDYKRAYWEKLQKWHDDWGYIPTSYVHNDWIASNYYRGPNGWCSPEGDVSHNQNIGKWPSPEEVLVDWIRIATAFPFLNLDVVILDREWSEDGPPAPRVGFEVRGGVVRVVPPDEPQLIERYLHHSPLQPYTPMAYEGRGRSYTLEQIQEMWGEAADRLKP